MKRYIAVILFVCAIGFGCAAVKQELKPVKNPATGTTSSPLQDQLTSLKPTVDVISAIPGVGQIAQGAYALLSVIALTLGSFYVNKQGNALASVVNGVATASDSYESMQKAILQIVSDNPVLLKKVQDEFSNITPIEQIISDISHSLGGNALINKLHVKAAGVTLPPKSA